MLDRNKVKVTGYMLIPIFGSSEVWTRMTRKPPSCEEQAKMIADNRWSEDTSGLAAGAAPGRGALSSPQQETHDAHL